MFKIIKVSIVHALLASILSVLTLKSAYAGPGTLPNAPLFLSSIVEPNVFMTLDDSGSMDWGPLVKNNTAGLATDQGLPIIDNDDQACYERILIVLLSYSLMRLGLSFHLVRFMCKCLRNAQYKLKLHDRITAPYMSTPDLSLQGTGQGTGWSPNNW